MKYESPTPGKMFHVFVDNNLKDGEWYMKGNKEETELGVAKNVCKNVEDLLPELYRFEFAVTMELYNG